MDLCDLLHSAPHLLTLLTNSHSLTELQAVDRKCHTLVHSRVKKLKLPGCGSLTSFSDLHYNSVSKPRLTVQHLQTLVAGSWPNLQSLSLDLQDLTAESAKLLGQAQWPVLQQLKITVHSWDSGCMLHICNVQPYLHGLSLAWGHMFDSTAEIKELKQADWPQLSRLKMHGNLHRLVSTFGAWPASQRIRELDLSCCWLETADLQSLALHKWLVLRRLQLADNVCDGHLLRVLCKACFPSLEELDLTRCVQQRPTIWITNAQRIVLPPTTWPALKTIKLAGNGIDQVLMTQLVKVKCPSLEVYDLEANCCTASMVQLLVHCSFPCLTELNLSGAYLDIAGVQELVKGHWPKLNRLDVSENELSIEAVSCLMTCRSWPVLRYMDVSFNNFAALPNFLVDGKHTLKFKVLAISSGTMPAWLLVYRPHLQWLDLSFAVFKLNANHFT